MEHESNNFLSLRDLCYVLFKYKVAIFILLFSTILTVFVGVHVWPETYEARSKLLIKLGKENVLSPTVPPSSQQLLTTGLRKEDINSEIEILTNRFIIEQVVQELGTDFLFPKPTKPHTFFKRIKFKLRRIAFIIRDFIFEILYRMDLKKRLSPHEKAVSVIQKQLSVRQGKDSDAIEVQLKWFSPDIATILLHTLIEFYLEHHLEVHRTSGGHNFLQKQVQLFEKRLKDSEDRLQLLKEREGITSYEDQRKFLLGQITNFKASLKNTQTELDGTIHKIKELKKQLSSYPETVQLTKRVNRNPIIDPLKSRLLELELEKKKLEIKYSDDSRPLAAIKEEIQEVKGRLQKEEADVIGEITTGVNTVYKEIEKELSIQKVLLSALNVKKEMLKHHIESYLKDLKRLDLYDIELKRLNRQIQIDDGNYHLYRKRLEESRISEVLDNERMVNVKMIDPPAASFTPIRPRKLLVIGLGLVLSFTFGIGFAFLSEYLDDSIKTTEDVRQFLNLPVLASIQKMKR